MVSTCVGPKTERPELKGTLRQRTKNGRFSYRLIVLNGTRKEFALQTRNYDEAVQKASELDSIWLGFVNKQVTRNEPQALPQMSEIRDIPAPASSPEPESEPDVSFEEAWEIYKMHPNRATPYTVEERIGYRRAFREFTDFASGITETSVKYPAMTIRTVTPKLCEEFSAYLKKTSLSVHTHNRKIKRLRLIFDCFKDYCTGDNPFRSKTLMRNEREELGNLVHRQAFTKEQEEQLLAVLSDSKRRHRLKNKTEIRIVYTIGMFTGQRLKDCVLLQDRATIEKTFMDLMALADSLNEEEQRYVREGFSSDEELSMYDMLFRDDLSKSDIQKLKKVAVDLLQKVKAKIAEFDHWTDKQETKSAVDNLIRDVLWNELPESYDELSVTACRQQVFEYVYTRYKEVS